MISGSFARLKLKRLVPSFVLAVACLSVFGYQNHQAGFEADLRGLLSAHGVDIGKNLVLGEGPPLLQFYAKTWGRDHRVRYEPYSRFPVFPFLLIGEVIKPFEPHLATQLYAARQLVNVFFVLAMVTCFLFVRDLTSSEVVALLATLCAFSAHLVLLYSDMAFNDTFALFGFVFALLLMVRLQRRPSIRLRSAVLLSFVPICFGWQPYAVFGAWALIDSITLWRERRNTPLQWGSFIRRPAILLTATAIGWGISILSTQLIYEWRVNGGDFTSGSTFQSMLWRMGFASHDVYQVYANVYLNWLPFLVEQGCRIVRMVIPFSGVTRVPIHAHWVPLLLLIPAGLLTVALVMAKKRGSANFAVVAACLLSGFLWSFPMRHFVAFHDFQGIFYIGIPIILFAYASLLVPRRAQGAAMLATIVLFVLAVRSANAFKASIAPDADALTAEFQKIYDVLPRGHRVAMELDVQNYLRSGMVPYAVYFYLTGSYIVEDPQDAEYAVSDAPNRAGQALTSNRRVNLYRLR
jgi:hypothetical protein